MELAIESGDFSGACDAGWSCAYFNISWRSTTTPMPRENNPRAVFEQLFGEGGNTSPEQRRSRALRRKSLLDSVNETASRLAGTLGTGDRNRLSEYLDAVRDVERRVERAEEQSEREIPLVIAPAGIPDTFAEHVKLMFDLQVLAYQSDMTRVSTFMLGRELSGRTYPELGITEPNHSLSHHGGEAVKLADIAKVNAYHATFFNYYLEKLDAIQDGDGSLLDHTLLLYGSPLSDGNNHNHYNIPTVLAGGASGKLKGGRHLKFADRTPHANLHVAMLHKLGVNVESHGQSSGTLDQL
jgi:hypothetical protein